MAHSSLRHRARAGFHPAQITGLSCSQALGLGGCVHGDEHHVCRGNRFLNGRGEKQIAAARPLHHRIQAWLIHRQLGKIAVVPSSNPVLIDIHNRDLHIRATIGDHRHGGATHIASADTANRSNGGIAAHRKNYGAVFDLGRLSLFCQVRQGVLPAELLFLTLTPQGLQPQLACQRLFIAKHHSPWRP